MNNPLRYFAELRDPRVERTREHLLEEILLMTIAAVLSGAGSWNEIEGYGKAKRLRFKSFLKLPGGIPSHDTFNRVISGLDTAELEKGFAAWVSPIAKLTAGEVVAIDGKALCGTRDRVVGAGAFVRYRGQDPVGGLAPAYFESVTIGTFRNLPQAVGVDAEAFRRTIATTVQGEDFRRATGPGANSREKLESRIATIQAPIRSAI